MKSSLKIIVVFLFVCSQVSFPMTFDNQANPLEIVQAGIYVIQIDNIDIKSQTFRAEFYLNLKWQGNRTAENFELINAIDYSRYFYSEWSEAGFNYLSCKIRGTFRTEMDVSNFPYDSQELKIQVGDYVWIEDSLRYVINDTLTGYSKGLLAAEWDIKGYTLSEISIEELGSRFSTIVYTLSVDRKYTSFIIKVLIPILIVMGVAMLNLFIDKRELESAIGLGVTSLLTIIALYFSISDNLPDVAYATTIDKMLMGSYLVIFITMIEIVYAHNLIKNNNIKALNRVERLSKWIIPTGYLLFLVILFTRIDLLWFL